MPTLYTLEDDLNIKMTEAKFNDEYDYSLDFEYKNGD